MLATPALRRCHSSGRLSEGLGVSTKRGPLQSRSEKAGDPQDQQGGRSPVTGRSRRLEADSVASFCLQLQHVLEAKVGVSPSAPRLWLRLSGWFPRAPCPGQKPWMQGASEASGSQSSFLFLLHRILITSSIPAAPERVGFGVAAGL